MSKAYFAGGCFWCICDYLLSQKIDGITDVVVGYCGGDEKDATYELIKSQKTKHRETIEISYESGKVTLEKLLELFVSYVDVKDPDGQYIDKGYSYTLALYYLDDNQRKKYEKFVNGIKKPAFISVEPFKFFVRAEDYHQHYGVKNPDKLIEELIASKRVCHLKLKNK